MRFLVSHTSLDVAKPWGRLARDLAPQGYLGTSFVGGNAGEGGRAKSDTGRPRKM